MTLAAQGSTQETAQATAAEAAARSAPDAPRDGFGPDRPLDHERDAPAQSRPSGRETLDAAFAVMGRKGTQDLSEPTPFELCLPVYLDAMGWAGEPRRLIEALPHFDPVATLDEFRLALANLGMRTRIGRLRLNGLTEEKLPCVFEHEGEPLVALGLGPEGALRVFSGLTGEERLLTAPGGMAAVCLPADPMDGAAEEEQRSWFGVAFGQIRRELGYLIALTFAANLLALSTPLFSMFVYNTVAPTKEMATLAFAVAAALGVLAFEDYLRRLRTRTIATCAARLNATILREAFARILNLPMAMTMSAPVQVQNRRLKQFETIFGVFSGGLAAALLDAPFIIVFLIAIAIIAGPLVYVPLTLLAVTLVLATFAIPATRRSAAVAGQRHTDLQDLARQTIFEAGAIRGLGAEGLWLRRLTAASRRAAAARFAAALLNQLLHGGMQALTGLAAVATLFVGTLLVMSGDLSVGGMIAVMMFIWRIFAPIQTTFLSAFQLLNARDTVRQLNGLMRLPTEEKAGGGATLFRDFKGDIRLDGVSFKYPGATELALKGVSFSAAPGEIVAIVGPTGAGKSTLLKLILGLYKPSAGAVYIDGLNLEQLDPREVRAAFGYGLDTSDFFFGTLAQNVRLAHPTATDEEISAELERLGVEMGGPAAPEGLATRMSSAASGKMTESVRRRIAIVRALVKNAPIYLFDCPTEVLEGPEVERMRARISALRGRATVLLVTAQPEMLRIADRVVALKSGVVLGEGPPERFLARAPSDGAG